jgi:hypothetical protein
VHGFGWGQALWDGVYLCLCLYVCVVISLYRTRIYRTRIIYHQQRWQPYNWEQGLARRDTGPRARQLHAVICPFNLEY